MLRTSRASVAVHPVVRPYACVYLAALAVCICLAGPASRAAFAQACSSGETVHVQFGSSLIYRANLSPDDDVTVIQAGAAMKYLANASDPGLGMNWTREGFDDSSWSAGSYGLATSGTERIPADDCP